MLIWLKNILIKDSLICQLLYVLVTNCVWKTCDDPLVKKGLFRCYPLLRIPLQASFYQLNKILVAVSTQYCLPIHAFLQLLPILGRRNLARKIISEKLPSSLCPLNDMRRGKTYELYNHKHLFIFVLSWKERYSCIKFHKNTSQRPHIDCSSIFDP